MNICTLLITYKGDWHMSPECWWLARWLKRHEKHRYYYRRIVTLYHDDYKEACFVVHDMTDEDLMLFMLKFKHVKHFKGDVSDTFEW